MLPILFFWYLVFVSFLLLNLFKVEASYLLLTKICCSFCFLSFQGAANVKVLACQAQSINPYKNLRTKTMKCCANIYFNKQCPNKKVFPKYTNPKISNTSPASHITVKEVQAIRLKN